MIKPTIGRIMWFWPHKEDRQDQPMAAIVVYVVHDHEVNLTVFDSDGYPVATPNVAIVQDGSPHKADDSPYCEWMPYQVGQAKKTEEAEAKARGAAA